MSLNFTRCPLCLKIVWPWQDGICLERYGELKMWHPACAVSFDRMRNQ